MIGDVPPKVWVPPRVQIVSPYGREARELEAHRALAQRGVPVEVRRAILRELAVLARNWHSVSSRAVVRELASQFGIEVRLFDPLALGVVTIINPAITAFTGAFPAVVTTNVGFNNSQATNHNIDLPASLVNGNLLIIVCAVQNNTTRSWSTPAGWTELYDQANGAGTGNQAAFYKTSDGAEGATVNVTLSPASVARAAWLSYQISGWGANPVATATPDAGASTTPNPPNRAFSSSGKNLVLATTSQNHNNDPSAVPTNYTDKISGIGTTSEGATVSSVRRFVDGAAEDPATWTIVSARWIAATISIFGS
jgi:hypothetical protein